MTAVGCASVEVNPPQRSIKQHEKCGLVELRLAAHLAGNRAQYAYVYGVALHSAGRPQDALAHLKESQNAHPGDREILIAITSFSREAGVGNSIATRRKIIQDCPDDPTVRRLLDELRCQAPPR
jgi:hypothetical protein